MGVIVKGVGYKRSIAAVGVKKIAEHFVASAGVVATAFTYLAVDGFGE